MDAAQTNSTHVTCGGSDKVLKLAKEGKSVFVELLAKHNTYLWISNVVSKLPSVAMLAPMRVTDTNINFIQFRPKALF